MFCHPLTSKLRNYTFHCAARRRVVDRFFEKIMSEVLKIFGIKVSLSAFSRIARNRSFNCVIKLIYIINASPWHARSALVPNSDRMRIFPAYLSIN